MNGLPYSRFEILVLVGFVLAFAIVLFFWSDGRISDRISARILAGLTFGSLVAGWYLRRRPR